MQPQDNAAAAGLPLPAPVSYLAQRCLTPQFAELNGIVPIDRMLAPDALRFRPPQFEHTTHALILRCREFGGRYHDSANQVVLFGKFMDPDTVAPLDRLRFSAKGIPNRVSWYGNTSDPKLVVYCESRIKALITSQANPNWLCAGLNGVDGWSAGKDKEDVIIPVANLIPPLDTTVIPAVLLPDSHLHKQVRRAMKGLTAVLKPHFRSVSLARLPSPSDGRTDWGADDVAYAYNGPAVLNLFVKADERCRDALALVPEADILARPAPQWIVRNLVPPGELTAIVGETSCGKTFLVMDLLLAVARGRSHWFGQRITAHGLVVHITLEGTSLRNRLHAYRTEHKIAESIPYFALETPINLRESPEQFIAAIQRESDRTGLRVALVAVDTVNRALSGGDENSSTDMGAFLSSAERIKSAFPGSGVVLVHHVGKDVSKGARGHSSFSANVGAQLDVDNDEKTAIRTVSIAKQREGRTDLKFNFCFKIVGLGRDAEGEEITSCVVQPSTAPAQSAEDDHRTRYTWIYTWFIGPQNKSRPVSKRKITDNLGNIKLRDARLRKADLEATVEWAKNMGYAPLAPEQPRKGEWYDLRPLPAAKY